MANILAISGLAGAGKNTVADFIKEKYPEKTIEIVSFASKLKDIVSVMFDLPRDKLEGINPEDRAWREEKLEHWSYLLGHDVTPRTLLQDIGTRLIKQNFHNDFWILALDNYITSKENDVDMFIITDCRYPNEMAWIKTKPNYMLAEVRRGDDPQWVTDYLEKDIIPQNIHISEYDWIKSIRNDEKVIRIWNNSTLQDLKLEVESKL